MRHLGWPCEGRVGVFSKRISTFACLLGSAGQQLWSNHRTSSRSSLSPHLKQPGSFPPPFPPPWEALLPADTYINRGLTLELTEKARKCSFLENLKKHKTHPHCVAGSIFTYTILRCTKTKSLLFLCNWSASLEDLHQADGRREKWKVCPA